MSIKPTIEAAIIEANRAKNPIRHVIDYDHRARCMDVLIDAARYRQLMKPKFINREDGSGFVKCPICGTSEGVCNYEPNFCPECGQALDWRKK